MQTYSFPTEIRFGDGVIGQLADYLKEHGCTRPLLVTDKGCAALPFFKRVTKQLSSSVTFCDIAANPVKSDVERGAAAYRSKGCDAVIGIGGGASMDVARCITLMADHGGDLFDYEDSKGGEDLVTGELPLFICVPTTSGTGSEVGRSAVISDDTTKEKKIIFSPRLLARCVFADPELTHELPASITAATGMDALTHNIEAYLARGFNPICDGIALEGMRLVMQNLDSAVHQTSADSRSAMMIASTMGAIAFQKGLGIVHSLAHPLSTLFDTHHGLANAIMLPFGLRFNALAVPERVATIAGTLGMKDVFTELQEMNQRLGLPIQLRSVGVTEESLPRLAELAFRDGCHQCNPVAVTQDDFERLYQEAL